MVLPTKKSSVKKPSDSDDGNGGVNVVEDFDDQNSVSSSSSSVSPASTKDASLSESDKEEEGTDNNNNMSIAGQETKAVRRFRFVLFAVLFLFMVMGSLGIYWYVRTDQISKFEEEFRSKGTTIISGFNDDSVRILQSLETLSTTVTAYALDANATWPFVTLPHSARLLDPYLVANVASLVMMPKVGIRQRTEWEHYVQREQGWIDGDLEEREKMMYEEMDQDAGTVGKGGVDPTHDAQGNSNSNNNRSLRRVRGTNNAKAFQVSANGRQLQTVTDDRKKDEATKVVSPYIKNYVGVDVSKGPWVVWWQYAPAIPNRWFVNFNRLAFEGFYDEVQAVWRGEAVISSAWSYEPGLSFQSTRDFTFLQELLVAGGNGRYEPGEPIGFIHYPIFDKFGTKGEPVAVLTATIYWKTYFLRVLPETTKAIVCVVENSLGQVFSYQVKGQDAVFLGRGDLHDPNFHQLELSADYSKLSGDVDKITNDYSGVPLDEQYISYEIRVYPTAEMEDVYVNNEPIIWLVSILTVFSVIIAAFIIYDRRVERRQRVVWLSAVRSGNVVSSLFPEHLRDRVMDIKNPQVGGKKGSFVSNGKKHGVDGDDSMPLADLYMDATVLYAQITNFTAWTSVREPIQVFTFLESVYQEFDKLANRRHVFKVETVQDCYVAVVGVPRPRKDHALVMIRFAHDIIRRMRIVSKELEFTLGPDTGDLGLRVGVHSGPVTAGVLRGDRARFQLFGQTMNMCAHIERTGIQGNIHCSKDTAALIKAAGKGSWLEPRVNAVQDQRNAVFMETYFVNAQLGRTKSVASLGTGTSHSRTSSLEEHAPSRDYGAPLPGVNDKTERLICWNVEMLLSLLQQVVANREPKHLSLRRSFSDTSMAFAETPLEEVKEIIRLPEFNAKKDQENKVKPEDVEIPPEVIKELHHFVSTTALMYHANPFHNFEHASHVVMSVIKLMSRIVAPPHLDDNDAALNDHSYGITNDPLTQFACAFSALIHDADHEGVSNAQLVKEGVPIASKYKERSVAEQNSLDLCWELLMKPDYNTFRAFLLPTTKELTRFRQLVVNSVMATDIVDKDLKILRNGRWDKAFKKGHVDKNPRDEVNRKATIVIEHIIQASDIAHTMQHFDVYLKWNKNLFMELYKAHKEGRLEKDPSTFWYKGEFGFFDFYIIPLTQKLKECGVFGVSSDEYLNYARNNREMWEAHGEKAVAEFAEEAKQLYDNKKKMPRDNNDMLPTLQEELDRSAHSFSV